MGRRATLASALAVAALTTSCRGCLETDVELDDAATTSVTSTSTSVASGSSVNSSSSAGGGTTSSAPATTSSTAGGSGAGGAGGAAACPHDDDFEVFSLVEDGGCWNILNPGQASLNVGENGLVLVPVEGAGWYNVEQGFLAYQEVTDDFAVAVHVSVSADTSDVQMGGIVVRDPGTGQENWMKYEIGLFMAGDWSTLAIRTINGQSVGPLPFPIVNEPESQETDIGMCRLDGVVSLAIRVDGEWTSGPPADDPGLLPNQDLQVGLNVAAQQGQLVTNVSTFSRFRIDDQPSESDCLEAMRHILP